jgi:hypothetical protein
MKAGQASSLAFSKTNFQQFPRQDNDTVWNTYAIVERCPFALHCCRVGTGKAGDSTGKSARSGDSFLGARPSAI